MIQPVAEFLTPEQLSARYVGRVTLETLEKWRRDRIGPAYYKFGGKILYGLGDVLAWEDRRRIAFDQSPPRGHSPLTRDLLTRPARIVGQRDCMEVVLLTLRDASAALGTAQDQTRALLRAGEIEAVTIGGTLLISRASIDAFAGRVEQARKVARKHRQKRARKAAEAPLLEPVGDYE